MSAEAATKSKPDASQVTLITVSSVAHEATIRALRLSMAQMHFATTLMFSDQPPPPGTDPLIEWRPIKPIRSRADYSRFMLHGLASHIETNHVLCAQWDGYVLDGSAWDPLFLKYDYIGAPWPQFKDDWNVGNGGFSLRSRKLLDACTSLPFHGEPEDTLICRTWRSHLESQGIRFAPNDVATKFSYERLTRRGNEFGFHGVFNLVNQLEPRETLNLLRSLEPTILSRTEHLELLRWAMTRGHMRSAALLSRRLIRRARMQE